LIGQGALKGSASDIETVPAIHGLILGAKQLRDKQKAELKFENDSHIVLSLSEKERTERNLFTLLHIVISIRCSVLYCFV
jgi:hypothetical protein